MLQRWPRGRTCFFVQTGIVGWTPTYMHSSVLFGGVLMILHPRKPTRFQKQILNRNVRSDGRNQNSREDVMTSTLEIQLQARAAVIFISTTHYGVGIATWYGVGGPGIESRWGRYFSYLSKWVLTPEPASCAMGTGSFLGGKTAGAWRS